MSGNSQDTGEASNYFIQFTKPTEEDLKRVFTEEELKELCLKHKCKVDVWRWNAVNDYRILFIQSGRYQRWSERHRLRMVAKAVNKMKPSVLYDEEEIATTRKKEWKIQLKENILSLNFWKSRAQRKTDEMQPELQAGNNTESLSQFRENLDEFNTNASKSTQSVRRNMMEDDFEEEYFEENYSNKRKQKENPQEILLSDINTEIGNIFNINTMSMTIDSDVSIQSQDVGILQSKCKSSHECENLQNIMHLRTQPQSHVPEEIIEASINDNHFEDSLKAIVRKERQTDSPQEVSHSDETDIEIGSIFNINTMSMIVASEISLIPQNLKMPKSQHLPHNCKKFKSIKLPTAFQSQTPEELIEDHIVSENLLKTVLTRQKQEILHTDETDADIGNMYRINTTSMIMDSDISIQTQYLGTLQSPHVTSHSYENFKSIIPVTSTQSQSQASEEIIEL